MPNAKAMLYDTPKASFTHKDLRALRSCFCLAKKWRKDWEKVQYCSERCRRNKSKPESETTETRLDKDLLR